MRSSFSVLKYALCAAVALLPVRGEAADRPVKIGVVISQAYEVPMSAARDLGYFKDAKIDAEITEYRSGTAAQEALSAGAADFISTFPPAGVLAMTKGSKQKIVGTSTPGASAWFLLVAGDSPIKSVTDLKGKKIGITQKGSTTDVLALWAGQQSGGSIETVPVGAGGLIPGLKSKQIDAVVLWPPMSLELMSSGNGKLLVDFNKEMKPPMLVDVWVASQDMIDKRPDDLRATLAGFYKAVNYMQSHKPEAEAFLKKYTQTEDQKVLDLLYQYATMTGSKDGKIDEKALLDTVASSAKAWENTDLPKLTVADMYDSRFLPKAQ